MKTTGTNLLLILGLSASIIMACSVNADNLSDEDKILADKAQSLLQAQLGSDAGITIASVETITWPDGAMGCPKAGMNYTQALVEGYRVVLEANGRKYSYHGRKGGDPFYCANPGRSESWIMDR